MVSLFRRLEQTDASLVHFYDRSLLVLPRLREGKSAQLPGRRTLDRAMKTLREVPSPWEEEGQHFQRESIPEDNVSILAGSFSHTERGNTRRFALSFSATPMEQRLAVEEIGQSRIGPTTVEIILQDGKNDFRVNIFDGEQVQATVSRRGRARPV
ncbi:MAG TPA: hypothetical protein VN711_02725 [Candidatus Saccharimonadales bacterium]|nr:hypothetical protein [Candidatus Saccharimonadales bacterium]